MFWRKNKRTASLSELNIKEQYTRDCEAMLKHALNTGTQVPSELVQTLEGIRIQRLNEAATRRIDINEPTSLTTEVLALKTLTDTHSALARVIAPATPESVRYIQEQKDRYKDSWFIISPIPFIRQMMAAALISLGCFLWLCTLDQVDFQFSMYNFKSTLGGEADVQIIKGIPLFLNMFFLMSAAGLGASFYALFEANNYITEGTFQPTYLATYWVRFTLGIISGLILAVLVPWGEGDTSIILTKPTLAMVGGFSAALVYRILKRLVDTVEILFGRKAKEIEVVEKARDKVTSELQTTKSKFTKQIAQLQELLGNEATPKDVVKTKVKEMLEVLLPGDVKAFAPTNPNNATNDAEAYDKEFSENEEQYRAQEYDLAAAKQQQPK